ncbi:MAG: hypothetical protein RR415_07180 [Ruthenibacterium sp.]
MLTFCTLFDSYYLDKALALYTSLQKVCDKFVLYCFCFDDRSKTILEHMKLSNVVLIHHKKFETEKLLQLKKERTKAEYCWTCTPIVIEYVLTHYSVENCTYIDADLYFFSNPKILFEEALDADVLITEHRFPSTKKGQRQQEKNGKYCVEYNYFSQNANSRKILAWWKEKCIEWCYFIHERERMGDQKYLNDWKTMFKNVHELQNLGGGVAPWNIGQYELVEDHFSKEEIALKEKKSNKVFNLVFYHFQNLRYLPNRKINLRSQCHNKKLKYAIYIPYIKEIEKWRKLLIETYGLSFEKNNRFCAGNKWAQFLQKNFAAYKIQSFSDFLNLDKLPK